MTGRRYGSTAGRGMGDSEGGKPYGGRTLFDAAAEEQDQAPRVLTVTQVMYLAKKNLEAIHVTVEGEVSEYSDKPGYKAVYFTIKDEKSALPCLMWKSDFARYDVKFKQGMLVQITGNFSLYAAKGRMNFVARSIKLAGEGDLRMKVALLAQKLQKEGLMDPARKKPLPWFTNKVAVVTSPRGKAVHDVLRTLRRRSPYVQVYVVGVPVEGDIAPTAICNGLDVAENSDCDVILLVRGGGSYEDLMPFNDEKVARKVAACTKPVITGIGHEPDNSISDMVADLRCSTPTAAAEASAMDVKQLSRNLVQMQSRMGNALSSKIEFNKQRIAQISSRPLFKNPNYLLENSAMRLDMDAERLAKAIPNAIASNKQELEQNRATLASLGTRLLAQHSARLDSDAKALARALPSAISGSKQRLSGDTAEFKNIGSHLLDAAKASMAVNAARLNDLSPLSVLSRGYAITYDCDGHVLSSIKDVEKDDSISVRVDDGYIDCTVNEVAEEKISK